MRIRMSPTEPLRDPDLRRFWVGETISMFGSQISFLALPLAAVLVLHSTPIELGVLRAAAFIPFLLVILPAGAWIDRVRRRPVLLASNFGRAALLAIIPAAAIAGMLSLPLLVVVAALTGVLTVLFEVAYLAYVPSLVPLDRLTAANARLHASQSAAQIGGPGIAGVLVGLVGAPLAIAADAVSLLFAGFAISGIRRPEPTPEVSTARPTMRASVVEGLRFVLRQPILRALAGEAAMFNLLFNGMQVAFLLFATQDLGMAPTTLGLAFSMGSIGSLVGSLAIGGIERRLGYGRTLVMTMFLGTLPFMGLGLATPGVPGFALIVASFLVGSFGVGATIVLVVTLRQTATPPEILGRAAATYRLLTYGVIPIGAVLGGVAVELVGARGAILLATAGIALAPIWILRSPIPRLRTIEDAAMSMPDPSPMPQGVTAIAGT